jgi:hypothetical protein
MFRLTLTCTALAIALSTPVIAADAAFCQTYRQISSTAGPCNNCTLRMTPTGRGKFEVQSGNGWRASVSPTRDSETVSGRGTWPEQGARFRVSLTLTSDTRMSMNFVIDGGIDFTAQFRCTKH